MELTSNLLQFLVTLLGFCLGAVLYRQNRRQAYFLLACFYGCFALGSLYWTLYLLLFSETPQAGVAWNLPAVCLVHDTVPVACENGGRGAGAADGGSGDVRYNPAA